MVTSANIAVGRIDGTGSLFQKILAQSAEWKLHWLLRLGVCMEFVGHGACGVHTKAAWLPYFRVFAIQDDLAWRLMPWIGSMDICLGLLALLSPRRGFLLYMGIWGCFTALLRPAAGEGGWEFIERAYNYGVPFAFLFLHGVGHDWKSWFAPLTTVPSLTPARTRSLLWMLRIVVALMLIGHGGFGAFMGKKNLLGFYQSAGLGVLGLPLETIRAGIGFLEIGLGATALLATRPSSFLFLAIWKVLSEMLFVVSGADLGCWEVVERGGSFVAPLAACCVLTLLAQNKPMINKNCAHGGPFVQP